MGRLEPVHYANAPADVRISEPAGGVFRSVVRGRATAGAAGAIIAFAEHMIAGGRRLLVFHDWENVSGYDADARKLLTEWSGRITPYWDGSHILFSSPLIAMAVAVASLSLRGKITTYSSRTSFERNLTTACSERGVALDVKAAR
ncbi:MAG: hypothetical protein ACRELY_04645 [Polyangiaceae bacterium]